MGLLLWIVSGLLAFGMAKSLRSGGALPWPIELAISIAAAVLFGFVATAFDFGGWKELEWRAGLFGLFGSAALIALARVANLGLVWHRRPRRR
jgi:hypothetical protein